MKNFLKLFSLLMFSGVLFVACGSNNSSGTTAAAVACVPGQICTSVSGVTSASCANPSYPYYFSAVNDPQMGNEQIPACCNTPSVTIQTLCVQSTAGYGTYGTTGVNGSSCIIPGTSQVGYYSNG